MGSVIMAQIHNQSVPLCPDVLPRLSPSWGHPVLGF